MASPAVFHVYLSLAPGPQALPASLTSKEAGGLTLGATAVGGWETESYCAHGAHGSPVTLGGYNPCPWRVCWEKQSTVESGGGGVLESGPSFLPSSRSQLTPPPAVPASQPFPGERTCPSPGVTSSSENNRMLFRPFHRQDAPRRGSLQDGQRTGSQGLEAGHIGPHVCFVWLAKYFYIFEPTVKGQVISYENPQFWLLP